MITKPMCFLLTVVLTIFSLNITNAQDGNSELNNKLYKKIEFFNLRGVNAVHAAVGSSVINGDYPEAEFEIYFRIGFKHHFTSNFNINLSYNKYNLAFKDIYNEGFMSFDLNLEYLFTPYDRFTPFVFGGYGYNAANYFEMTSAKAQGGIGVECILIEGLGVKLFGEYNYSFSDELDGLVFGDSDDTFWRIALGVNIYFGGKKRKERLLNSIETIINSNLIK
jgi:curli production assembly/transport component CsgG